MLLAKETLMRLAAGHMVKVESYWMLGVAAVNAALRYLVGIKPVTDGRRPITETWLRILSV